MNSWIIVVGAAQNLAFSELHALFPSSLFVPLSGPCMFLEKPGEVSPETLQDVAGGVVKIAEVVCEVPVVTPEKLAEILVTRNTDQQKITFGVSRYDGEVVSLPWLGEIKAQLVRAGKKARFVSSRDGILSSVVIQKEHVQELVIAKRGNQFFLGVTITVQDFEAWNKRDYGRPYADPKLGMLPPKAARMVVNISVGPTGLGKTILDPFCGMGTILAEALLRGCRVIGSDLSGDVINKAQKNLEWLQGNYQSIDSFTVNLFVCDATHVSENLPGGSVDAIVTEPFMGPALGGNIQISKYTNDKLENTIKGLEKLYIGCLKDWRKILTPGGKVVIALPQYSVGGRIYVVKKVVDNCENLGYSKILGPIEYSRPQAVVKREFYVFQKK